MPAVKAKQGRTLALIFKRPASANVRFDDAVASLRALGAEIDESREGSRVALLLFDDLKVMHIPHPDPNVDKAAVAELRDWFSHHGVKP